MRDGNQVIVQFSHPDFYGSILEEVDELCASLDENFGVRFYAHCSLSLDGRTLLRIPHVKMLHLDSLVQAHHTETLAVLKHLCSLHLGIYELENPDILEFDSLRSLRDLVIISDKRVLNLEYFKAFSQLEHLRFFYPAKASGGIVRSGTHDLQKQSGSGNTRFLIKDGFSKLEHLNIHGSLSVIVDGAELLSVSLEGDQRHEPNMSSIYLEQGNELTIQLREM